MGEFSSSFPCSSKEFVVCCIGIGLEADHILPPFILKRPLHNTHPVIARPDLSGRSNLISNRHLNRLPRRPASAPPRRGDDKKAVMQRSLNMAVSKYDVLWLTLSPLQFHINFTPEYFKVNMKNMNVFRIFCVMFRVTIQR
jgi:hypothetical protein